MSAKVVLGLDIGGTTCKYGLTTYDGKVLFHNKISSKKYENFEDFAQFIVSEATSYAEKHDYELIGYGIGAPNANFYRGTIEHAPNLIWKGYVSVKGTFSKFTSLPTIITNDANAATLGEKIFGGAKKMSDFVVVTLGTGLGSGIFVNNQLVHGNTGFAGELGHMCVKPGGRHCNCSRRGCLETYVSATGVCRTAFKLLSNYLADSPLRDYTYRTLTAHDVYIHAKEGDFISKKVFEFTGKIFGAALTNTVVHTSPEAIFLYGGLAEAFDLLVPPMQIMFDKRILPIYKGKTKVFRSSLNRKSSAAILGAASLIWDQDMTSTAYQPKRSILT